MHEIRNTENNIIGFFMFGKKINEEPFKSSDLLILKQFEASIVYADNIRKLTEKLIAKQIDLFA